MIAGSIEIELFARIARLQSDMNQARQVVTRSTDGMERAANAAKAALAGIGAGIGLSQLVQMSDAYAKFTAQLRLASQSQREYAAAYGDVKRIANAAQQDLGATGMLYARIANGTRELGTTQKQVAAITETVNLALKVSGATATESASAQLQLSQAFASGTLRGEEFNAVNEAAPRLMLALADGIGVPVGAVKKMAEEGKISSAIMADVLPKALAKVREEAAQIQTIGGALTVLKNNVMEFVGVQANASGAVATLTGAIGFLADNLVLIAGAVATLTTAKLASWLTNMVTNTYGAVTANRALAASTLASAVATTEAAAIAAAAKLTEAQANVRGTASAMTLANARVAELRAAVLATSGATSLAIATNGLIPAQARAIALAEANAVALSAQAVAANAATVTAGASAAALGAQAAAATFSARAMVALRGAVGFLGGPIGAVITLLGLAATAWMVWGDKAEEGNDKAVKSTDESTTEMIARLDKQIEKLRERNKLADTEPRIKGLGEMSDADKDGLARAKAALDANRASAGGMYDHMFSKRRIEESTLALNYETALKRVGQAQDEVTRAALRNKAAETAAWLGQNGSNAQKLAYELEGLRKKFGEIPAAIEAATRAKYADKGAAATIKQEASAYQSLVTSIGEKIAANKLDLAGFDKLSDAQKMTIKLDEAIAAGKNKLTPKHIEEARAMIATVAAQDKVIEENKFLATQADEKQTAAAAAISAALAQAKQNEFLVQTFGMTKSAIEGVELARLEEQLAQVDSLKGYTAEISTLEELIAVKKRNIAAVVKLEVLDTGSNVTRAKELLDILTAVDQATKSAASGMAESFGRVGSAIGGLTTALSGYAVQQQAIMAQLAAAKADPKNGPDKIAKLEIAAAHASAQAKIKSYGDMAGAAKGFFKENTKGYKVMEGAEKAFRAYEMAMAMQTMIKKIFFKEGEVAANLALNGVKLTGEAATTAASTGLAATEASAWGVTAVVKALASLPFPWNLAAGAATLAAVVAIGASMMGGIGGGASSAPLSEERQKTQGTGTVLGDETAKSESIAKSLEMMEGYASLELEYQNSMLTALRNIEIALGGAAKGLLQTVGITGGSAFGTIASSDKSTFGASHTKDITDSGVKFSGSFGQLRAGQGTANQYEVVRTTSDGGMFRSGWTRDDPKYKALAEEAKRPFALIFDNMGDLLVDAGVKLGRDGASLTSAINSIGVNFEVSLRDLKGQELTDALNAGISVAFDKVTKELFPTITQFQKMGEGLGETLVRVAADVQGVDSVFASMGKSLTTTVTRNMSSIGGWFTGIYNGVAQSVTVVTSMSLEAKERLVEASGGLEKLASQASSFMQNFYSDDERNAATKAKLNPALAQYGLSTEGPNALKMFRQFVLGLDTSTASGAKTYAMLMDVQQAFKDVTAATADERTDLQKQLDQLTLTRAQLLERERSALDASNRGLWDQVQAAQKAKDAQDAAKTSLGDFISKMGSFASSTKALSASMLVGSLSTLTPEQQYEQLRNQYESTKAAALGGDTTAQGNFSQSLTAYLAASQKINGGDSQYASDFAMGRRDADMMAQWATGQVDVAQASLNALNDQVSGINSLNMTMLQVAQSIDSLPADLVATVAQAVLPVDYSRMRSSGNTELLAEVKVLNTKIDAQNKLIDGLRADQQRQTGDLITSNAAVTAKAAEVVVDGLDDANTNARSRDYQVNLHAY